MRAASREADIRSVTASALGEPVASADSLGVTRAYRTRELLLSLAATAAFLAILYQDYAR